MQNSRPVLLTAAAAGSAAVLGALFGADQFAAQAGVLTLGSLGVLVAAGQRAGRRVWWSLLAGVVVLAVAVAVPDLLTPPVSGPQRFEPTLGGTDTFVQDVVAGEWLTTVAVLLAAGAFLWATAAVTVAPTPAEPVPMSAEPVPVESPTTEPGPAEPRPTEPAATELMSTERVTGLAGPEPAVPDPVVPDPVVTALPAHRRAEPAIVAATVGSLLIAVTLVDLGLVAAGQQRGGAAGELIAAVALPLVVALFAVVSAVFGAYRVTGGPVADGKAVTADEPVAGGGTVDADGTIGGGRMVAGGGPVVTGGLVAAGGLLLAGAALAVVYTGVLSAPLPYGYSRNLIFDAAVARTGWGVLDPIAALKVAAMLAGAGCVVHGCLRAAQHRA